MMEKLPLKPNILLVTGMTFVSGILALAALVFANSGVVMPGTESPLMLAKEIQLLLASYFGGSMTGTVALATQMADNPAPNPHQAHLDHEYRMAQLELEEDLSLAE